MLNFEGHKFSDTGVGYSSKFCATKKLIELFFKNEVSAKTIITDPNAECIILKGADGTKIEYQDTDFTFQCRSRLREYNQLLARTDIRVGDQTLPPQAQVVKRIFNVTFDRGGRFYCAVWHTILHQLRNKIIINGDKTFELDFSGFHPTMLYHLKGLERPDRMYRLPQLDIDREINKKIFNTMINTRDITQAKRAVQSEINFGKFDLPKHFSPEDVINELLIYHSTISDCFFTNIGLDLQFIDSQMTSEIMRYFTDRNIPVLTVHDSFIVAEQYKHILMEQMIKAYQCGFHFVPKIECKMSCDNVDTVGLV